MARYIRKPREVKMMHCEEFLEKMKQDFATEWVSSDWNVWYEIGEYDIYLKITKTDDKIVFGDKKSAFDDDEAKVVYKIVEHHKKNSFHKLRDQGWCCEYNPRGSYGYFEFMWCSPGDYSEEKKCNCRHCLLTF